jgi:hypothetical protein
MMARKKSLDTLNNMIYVQDDSDQEMWSWYEEEKVLGCSCISFFS